MNFSELVRIALQEDLPTGDATSQLLIDEHLVGHGYIVSRESAVVSGLQAVAEVFTQLDNAIEISILRSDGSAVVKSDKIVEIRGNARSILAAERTALNFLGYLSGIATMTRAFVEQCRGTHTKILGTRKILPGFRDLGAAAIRHGGGDIYRVNLSDAVLIKDNHLICAGGIAEIHDKLQRAEHRTLGLGRNVLEHGKLEVDNLAQLETAAATGWKHILLDNFSVADARRAVELYGDRIELEASGGITLENVAEYAATGVHYISTGALTHSVRNIDFSLEMIWKQS